MKILKRYTNHALTISLSILCIGGVMAAVSCKPDMPQKPLPAYYFNIKFPEQEESISTLTVERGSSATLPVTVTSNSDVPISIRLTLKESGTLPGSITFETRQDYAALQPEESITLYVTFNISGSTAPGRYNTGIHGELKEPVTNRALMTQGIHLNVVDR